MPTAVGEQEAMSVPSLAVMYTTVYQASYEVGLL